MVNCNILLVSFPAQGHINPAIQFAKRLLQMGAHVTFFTSASAITRMFETASKIPGLTLAPFSDGYDNGWSMNDDLKDVVASITVRGSEAIKNLVKDAEGKGRPFAHIVYSTVVPWAGEVANQLQIPSTLLWNQSAAVFYLYYMYFNKKEDFTVEKGKVIELPGLPFSVTCNDLPSFLQYASSDPVLHIFGENFEVLDKSCAGGTRHKVLVNTFHAMEVEALRALKKYDLMSIGPLIPSAFLDGNDPSDTSFGGDLIKKTVDYMDWLNSKYKASVIYAAFGSFLNVPKKQLEEIAKGLIKSQKPFLWVIRQGNNGEEDSDTLTFMKEAEKHGMIVPWCSQMEVLSHSSVGCFMTHCGWNSTMESLVTGVPVVGFPQWSDQFTNAKLLQEYWKTGLRLQAKPEHGGIVMADEIARCIEVVMGDGKKGQDMRKKAQTWKNLAKEAATEGGSSNVNLQCFIDQIVGNSQK